MDGRRMGAGAGLFGFGAVALVAAAIFAAPTLMPIAQLLMGSGGVLFLHGLAKGVPYAGLLLFATGLGVLAVGTYLLVTRLAVGAGFSFSWFSLAWLLTLLASGLYTQAARPALA